MNHKLLLFYWKPDKTFNVYKAKPEIQKSYYKEDIILNVTAFARLALLSILSILNKNV